MGWCRSTNTYTDDVIRFFSCRSYIDTNEPTFTHLFEMRLWCCFLNESEKNEGKNMVDTKRKLCRTKKKDIVFFNTVECFLNILIQWKYMRLKGINSQFSVFSKSKNLGNCLNSFDFCKTFNITNNISKDAISPLELSPNKHLAHSRIKQISLSGIFNNQIL